MTVCIFMSLLLPHIRPLLLILHAVTKAPQYVSILQDHIRVFEYSSWQRFYDISTYKWSFCSVLNSFLTDVWRSWERNFSISLQLGWKIYKWWFLFLQRVTETLIKFRVHAGNRQQIQFPVCLLRVCALCRFDLLWNETLWICLDCWLFSF